MPGVRAPRAMTTVTKARKQQAQTTDGMRAALVWWCKERAGQLEMRPFGVGVGVGNRRRVALRATERRGMTMVTIGDDDDDVLVVVFD